MNPETIGMFYPLTLFVLITVLIVVMVWQGFATWRARAAAAREEAYRKLAEQSVAAQQNLAKAQEQMSEELQKLCTQVTAIEKLLREVG